MCVREREIYSLSVRGIVQCLCECENSLCDCKFGLWIINKSQCVIVCVYILSVFPFFNVLPPQDIVIVLLLVHIKSLVKIKCTSYMLCTFM